MTLTLESEPACPEIPTPRARTPGLDVAAEPPERSAARAGTRLRIERRPFEAIPPRTWDCLVAETPSATPFSSWAFHRAWWDAYGENADELTLVAMPWDGAPDAEPVAIIPLMRRHEVEPDDVERHTTLRHDVGSPLTPVPPNATAIFFGASYHADYATILADPARMPAVAEALADHLAGHRPGSTEAWDAIDLRRLRADDPAGPALATAFGRREIREGWTLNVEREDVCPVVTLPSAASAPASSAAGDASASSAASDAGAQGAPASIDDVLAGLERSDRHEIRRKVRRAEAAGPVELTISSEPLADLETFIDLHQRRWGADGLFPPTPGGDQSRTLFRRLFETFGPNGAIGLSCLSVGDRRIAAGVHFETDTALLYYNAGIDPDARDLSPGVLLVERYVRYALARGLTRLDFLRGDEPYKYEWGAVDEPVQRILVRRTVEDGRASTAGQA